MTSRFPIDGSRDALWMATAVAAPATSSLDADVNCDVVVIGAGFTGLNAALALARSGASVRVLDGGDLGFGASGRSGGQVNLGLNLGPSALRDRFGAERGERLVELVARTPDDVFELIRRERLDCDAVQAGWVQGAISDAVHDAQRTLAAEYRAAGVRVEVLDGDAVAARSGSTRYRGGLFVPSAGSLHPLSYTRELARVCLEAGASIHSRSRVDGIARDDAGWTVATAGGSVRADTVLVCTNGYTGATDDAGPTPRPLPSLARKLVPVRSVLVATEPLSDELRASILPGQVTFVDKRRLILYARYDRDGRLCVGDHGPARDAFRLTDFDAVKRRALAVWPPLAGIGWAYHWGGRVAMTRSSLPFIHEAAPGLFACMGYNGRGVGMGSALGRVLGEQVASGGRDACPFPITRPADFLGHRFNRLGVAMSVKWYGLLDRLEEVRAARAA